MIKNIETAAANKKKVKKGILKGNETLRKKSYCVQRWESERVRERVTKLKNENECVRGGEGEREGWLSQLTWVVWIKTQSVNTRTWRTGGKRNKKIFDWNSSLREWDYLLAFVYSSAYVFVYVVVHPTHMCGCGLCMGERDKLSER